MLGQNRKNSKRRWENYRKLGKTKFILFFSVYFSLAMSVINFFLELAAYGYASPYMAVIRFITYVIISPIMALIIWNISEKKYMNQDET